MVFERNPPKAKAKQKELKILSGHRSMLSAVTVAGKKIFTASWDKTIRVWEDTPGQQLG